MDKFFISVFSFLLINTGAIAQNIYSGGDNDGFSFGKVGAPGNEAPLPIELLDFTAKYENGIIYLSWTTSSETENDYFTIEKSRDAVNWNPINKINGAGNSRETKSYNLTDNKPFIGISYYRLKQTDFDGKFTYSKIETIYFDKPEGQEITIYPNPTNNRITILGSATEIKTITIYSISGQDVTSITKVLSKGEGKVVLDLSQLTPGIYNLKTTTITNTIYKK